MSGPGEVEQAKAGRRALWAWSLYDWAGQSFATVIQTFVFASYFTNEIARDSETGTTQWSLTIGCTGILVALLGPVLGAVADRAGRRKPWLAGFTALCAAATAAMWFVHPEASDQGLALALLAVGVFGTQMAIVFYNAMLGDLATPREFGKWSGRGWALGYAGGICCLLAVLVLFIGDHALLPLDREAAVHIRATFPFVAIWFVLFALPVLLIAPDRPGARRPLARSVREGCAQLRDSFRKLRPNRGILRFLIARALYMDGLATVFALGGVYAAGTFGMGGSEILIFGIALNFSAGAGAVAFSVIEGRLGARRSILLALAGLFLFSTLILLAPGETAFWICGVSLGLFVGPVQSSSRSYFSLVVPNETRTQMFGLYAFADKATSFIGPLLVGGLSAWTGSQRLALIVIPLFFALGWFLLRGVAEAVDAGQMGGGRS